MSERPSRATDGGNAYLELRRLARQDRRPTDEYLQLYALEGFLDRLAATEHAGRFVLKGGVLLAAYAERRPTRDIDLAGIDVTNDLEQFRQFAAEVIAIERHDGLVLDESSIGVTAIREDDAEGSARVSIRGSLATARISFHVDINIGDPIWPAPVVTDLPRLLGGEPIRLRSYPIELVLAEKIVTALQRGTANTRWRDFVDIATFSRVRVDTGVVVAALTHVAEHRHVSIRPLRIVLDGFAALAQQRWAGWRRKQQLTTPPESLAELLETVIAFTDPLLNQAGRPG